MILHEDHVKIMQFVADITSEIIARSPMLKVNIYKENYLGDDRLNVTVVYANPQLDEFSVQHWFDDHRIVRLTAREIATCANNMINELTFMVRKSYDKRQNAEKVDE